MCDARLFNEGYHCCRLTRNLQILGAFGFLSRRKNKHYFEQYIPVALKTLHRNLSAFDPRAFPQLKSIVEALL
jgi:aminoglycoside/choline kinase family phosphotransferase